MTDSTDIENSIETAQLHDIVYTVLLHKLLRSYAVDIDQIKPKSATFLRDNTIIIGFSKSINDWLTGWAVPSIPLILQYLQPFLRKNWAKNAIQNNLILDAPRGCGKTELLSKLIVDNNPRYYNEIKGKMLESELVEKPKSYFQEKIMVNTDLLQSFTGVSPKQRSQLTNFWTGTLDNGRYSRDKHKQLLGVKTMAAFGIASESMPKFHQRLLDETVFERLPPMKVEFTIEEMKKILEFKNKIEKEGMTRPKIILPGKTKKKVKHVYFDEGNKELTSQINSCAIELQIYQVLSHSRAQTYIENFCMTNAAFNDRQEVCQSDIDLWKIVHPHFITSSQDLSTENYILNALITMKGSSDTEIMKIKGIKERTFYKYKKILKQKGVIP